MFKKQLLLILAVFSLFAGFSQTLFSYGKYSVTAPEFLRAFNKNNVPTPSGRAKAMRDYLQLFINSKLKIREAYERGYDTMAHIKMEVDNLRNQIVENYMSDPETMNKLTREAFTRSQKDIHAAHIFIAIERGDTAAAYSKATSVLTRLQKGEDFLSVAQQTSHDPAAKSNRGDIGWITVFSLPYQFENVIYSLSQGKHSTLIRSKAGYHILKNLGERKAVGKMKAKQILLAFPPGIDDAGKKLIAKKADSIYKRIIAGEDFGNLAKALSNDYVTSVTGGNMPDFGISKYEPAFETKVWALTKDGAVSRPFATTHGYHIVKRVGIVPVVSDPNNKTYAEELHQKILQDQRWKTSREVIYNKVVKLAGLSIPAYNKNELWAFTDSILDRKPMAVPLTLKLESPVFKLGDSTLSVSNWITYAQAFRFKNDGSGRKTYPEVMDELMYTVALKYYRDHLEDFNDEFRFQMNEFRDGNLFFEIMQQEIWNRAHTDTAQLVALYEANKNKYNWKQSADAVIFYCSDGQLARSLHEKIKKNPSAWRSLANALEEKVVADSSRFEWSQLPSGDKIIPVNGMVTSPVLNTADNSVSFAYIIKTYPQQAERSFNDARGLVINDYQALLEEQWIKRLKEKYPVVIDQKVLDSIAK